VVRHFVRAHHDAGQVEPACARSKSSARRQRPEEADDVAAFQLAANNNLPVGVGTVDLETGFGEIKTNCGNLPCVAFSNDHSGASMPESGAVHPFKN